MGTSIDECDEGPENEPCVECSGVGCFMGFMGAVKWFRCRQCGFVFNAEENTDGEQLPAVE